MPNWSYWQKTWKSGKALDVKLSAGWERISADELAEAFEELKRELEHYDCIIWLDLDLSNHPTITDDVMESIVGPFLARHSSAVPRLWLNGCGMGGRGLESLIPYIKDGWVQEIYLSHLKKMDKDSLLKFLREIAACGQYPQYGTLPLLLRLERNFLQPDSFLQDVMAKGLTFRIPNAEDMEKWRSERDRAAWERHGAPEVEAMVDLPYFMDQRPTPHPPEGPPCLASKSAPLRPTPHPPEGPPCLVSKSAPLQRAPHAPEESAAALGEQAQLLQQFGRVTPLAPQPRPAAAVKALLPPPPRPAAPSRPTAPPAGPPIMQRTPKYRATPKKRPNSARQEPPAPKTKNVPVQPKSPPLPPTGPPPKGSSSTQSLARSASEPAGKELPRAPNNKGMPKRMPRPNTKPAGGLLSRPPAQRAVGSVSLQSRKRPATGVPEAFARHPKPPGEPPQAFRGNSISAPKAAPEKEEMEEVWVDWHSEDPATPKKKVKEAWPRTPEPHRSKDVVADAMGRGFGAKLRSGQMATRKKVGSVGLCFKEEKEADAPGQWLSLLQEKPNLETLKQEEKEEWKTEEEETQEMEEFELEDEAKDEKMALPVDNSGFEDGGEEPDQSMASGSVEDSNSDDTSGRDEPGAPVRAGRIDLRNYGQEFLDDKEKQIEQNNRIAARWGGTVQVPLASGTAQSRKGSFLKGQQNSVVSRLRRNPPPPSPGTGVVSPTESTGTLQPQEPPYPPPPPKKKKANRGGAGSKARAAARRKGHPIESVAPKFRIKKEKGSEANQVREVFASEVLFSQDSMKDCFQCGRPLEYTVEQLLRQEILPSHPIFRKMNLYETEQGLKTKDNRRLWCLKELEKRSGRKVRFKATVWSYRSWRLFHGIIANDDKTDGREPRMRSTKRKAEGSEVKWEVNSDGPASP